jgi:1,4-alpha-glucan branching enzyme
MVKKTYSKNGKNCKVTFKIPVEMEAAEAAVLGEWNEWDAALNPMTKRKDGSLSTTVSLDAGKEYRFRYLLDGRRWENDTEADGFVRNRFGTQDCVLHV